MLLATAEANNLATVAKAKTLYTRRMENICGGEMSYMHPDALEKQHRVILEDAMTLFETTPKMGGVSFRLIAGSGGGRALDISSHPTPRLPHTLRLKGSHPYLAYQP
jgi:hypothetical protein